MGDNGREGGRTGGWEVGEEGEGVCEKEIYFCNFLTLYIMCICLHAVLEGQENYDRCSMILLSAHPSKWASISIIFCFLISVTQSS